jgi:hypothetical protein
MQSAATIMAIVQIPEVAAESLQIQMVGCLTIALIVDLKLVTNLADR